MNLSMMEITTLIKLKNSLFMKRKTFFNYLKKFFSTGLAGHRTLGNIFQFSRRPLFVVYYNVDYTKNVKGIQTF